MISKDLAPRLRGAGIVDTASEPSDHRPVWMELFCKGLATARQQSAIIQKDPVDDLRKRLNCIRELEKGETLTILDHNIFWQQGMPYENFGEHPAVPAIQNELVELHTSLDVDLLCLQEVQNEEAAGSLALAYGAKHWQWTPDKNQKTYGIMMASSLAGEFADHRAWDLPDEDTPQGALMTFHINLGLKVANLHLPSGRNLTSRTKEESQAAELKLLVPQKPDLIVGDFNALHQDEC